MKFSATELKIIGFISNFSITLAIAVMGTYFYFNNPMQVLYLQNFDACDDMMSFAELNSYLKYNQEKIQEITTPKSTNSKTTSNQEKVNLQNKKNISLNYTIANAKENKNSKHSIFDMTSCDTNKHFLLIQAPALPVYNSRYKLVGFEDKIKKELSNIPIMVIKKIKQD